MRKKDIKKAKEPLGDISIEDLDEESKRICLQHEGQITKYFRRKYRPNRDDFNRWLLKMRDDYLLIALKYASHCHRQKPSFGTSEKLWELSEKLSDRFEGKPATKADMPVEKTEGGVVILPKIEKVHGKKKDNKKESNLEATSWTSD